MRIYVLFAAWFLSGVSAAPVGASQGGIVPFDGLTRDIPLRAATSRQNLSDAGPLTLQAALDEALDRNPRLIVLRRQYDAMRHRPEQALALAPPSFEAQIWQWPFNTLNAGNVNMYMFTIGQALPGVGKRDLRAAVAEKDAELSLAAIAVEARDVVDHIKHVYAELFLARREAEIHHANLDLLRQFVDVSEAKYVSGGSPQHDSLKAIVELSRLHEHLVTLGERGRLAEARLNTLLDRAPDAPIGVLMDPMEEVALPPLATLQRLGIGQQPDLRSARLAVERAEAAVAAERQEEKPDFFVKGGYMLMPGMPDSWTATVGITWPTAPWSRGTFTARASEAVAVAETARAQYANTESTLRLAAHAAYVRAEAARERAALLRTSIVPQSDQMLAVSRVAYQANQADLLTVIDNQRMLLDAQLAYYRALNDLEQARAELERAVGVDLAPTAAPGGVWSAGEETQP